MANEFKHKDPGATLTQDEYITTDGTGHIFDSQAQGDILYATSTTVISRLGKSGTSTHALTNTGTNDNPKWAQIALATGVSGTLPVGNGGTGATTLTDGGILIGNGTGTMVAMAVLADGEIVVGDGTTDPVALAAFSSSTGTLKVASGGTGASSLTDKSVLISQDSGTDTVGAVDLTTSGELVIGGSSGPVGATLTAGTNVTITNGDGTISIAAAGGSVTAINNATANELVTIGSTTTELDAEANLTFDGTDLTVGAGNVIIGTAGKGIDFSATANSSGTMANELFDDYEEGTFSPELWDDGNDDASAGYDTQTGNYTKIGNIVHFSFRMHMNAITGLTTGNNATIGGLPFAPSSASFGGGGNATYMTLLNLSTDTNIMLMTESTSPELAMYQSTATNADAVLISEVSADGLIQAAGHYMTAT